MYLLSKLAAFAIAIWFYMTADEHSEPPFKWVVTGLIGYVIVWLLVDFAFDSLAGTKIAKSGASFIIDLLPAVAGLGAAYFIRKKMLSNLTTTKSGEK